MIDIEVLRSFGLMKWFGIQNWSHLLSSKELVYPRLMKLFYYNLKFEHKEPDVYIFTKVKGIEMHLDCESMNTILRTPNLGNKFFVNGDFCGYLRASWNDVFDTLGDKKLKPKKGYTRKSLMLSSQFCIM